jgi:hypothetical protein
MQRIERLPSQVIGDIADNEKSIILEKIPSSAFDPERLIDVEATVLGIREFVGNSLCFGK